MKPYPTPFQANNAFLYYADLPRAVHFYQDVIGARLVADYGFAKILQLAATSFLTLVDAKHSQQHSLDEPKTVTLALVTEQVEGWYDYLLQRQVPIQHALNWKPNQAHDGFVALDPEGYFVEVERFNPHAENMQILPRLQAVQPLYPDPGRSTRPANLGVIATVLWLYYQEIALIRPFYEQVYGLEMIVDQGFAQIYPTSPSGFLGPVHAGKGLHRFSEKKAVTVSLLTDDLDSWVAKLRQHADFRLRTSQIEEHDPRYRAFVGYDPAGYFMEFNTFLEHPENQRLLAELSHFNGLTKWQN